MATDGINPRTGIVVALCSIFLFFGFMFTVSGLKGERLGDIPLIAIGPAICLPGVLAIVLASKTNGCTEWPVEWRCAKRKKTNMSQNKSKYSKETKLDNGWGAFQAIEDSSLSTTKGEPVWLTPKAEKNEVLIYWRPHHPSGALVAPRCVCTYCMLDKVPSPVENIAHGMQQQPFTTAVPCCKGNRDVGLPLLPIYWSFTNPRDFKLDYETVV